jgi:predicted DNA-binding WGR domain protein
MKTYWLRPEKIKLTAEVKKLIKVIAKDHADDLGKDTDISDLTPKGSIYFMGRKGDDEFYVDLESSDGDMADVKGSHTLAVAKALCVLTLTKDFTFTSDGITVTKDGKVAMNDTWKEAINWFMKQGHKEKIKKHLLDLVKKEMESAKALKPVAKKKKKSVPSGQVKTNRTYWEGRYEFIGGTSRKYWSIYENANGTYTARWGKIGTAHASNVKEYSYGEASKKAQQKLDKGYDKVDDE